MKELLTSSDSSTLIPVNYNYNDKNNKEYNYGLDIYRIIGMFYVICHHAYIYNNFWEEPLNTLPLFLCVIGKFTFLSCVPIFLLLTGYLKKEKKISTNYYINLSHIIIEYIICSTIIIIFRIHYLKENVSKEYIINGFLHFYNAPYSWYVGMYINLYLLSPFFNMLYNNIPSLSQKLLLLFSLLMVCSLCFTVDYFGWSYFYNSYPILYYFIGCFLRDYKPHLKKTYLFILYIIIIIVQAFIKKYSSILHIDGHENFFCVCSTVVLFLLFYNLKSKKKNIIIRITRKIADTSLSCYLLSYIFDQIFQKEILSKRKYNSCVEKIPYLMFIVPTTFLASVILGLLTHRISMIIMKILFNLINVIKECYKGEEERRKRKEYY